MLPAFLAAGTVNHNLMIAQPRVYEVDGYHYLALDNAISTGNIGDPRLPVVGLNLILPPGEDAAAVTVEPGTAVSLGRGFTLPPVQRQHPLSLQGPFEFDPPNPQVYQTNDFFPQDLMASFRTDYFRGFSIAAVAVNPVTYNPVTGEVLYYPNLTVRVETAPSSKAQRAYSTMLKRNAATYQQLARQADNPADASLYGHPNPSLDVPYYDILLITHAAMVDMWEDYIEWKTKAGFYVAVETVQDIYNTYPGIDNQDKIRNCIIDYYQEYDLTYVFLAADDEVIPHRGLYASSGYTDNDIAADLYYAGLDGNWNNDGDTHWGEPDEADLRQEVYVSRAGVDSEEEITNFTNKQLMFANEPVVNEVETALMAGEDLGWPIWAWEYKEEVRTGSSSWGFTTAPFPADWEVRTLYEVPGYSWSGLGDLLPRLNLGPLYVNHLGHADVTYMMQIYNSQISNANVTNNGIDHNFYLIYSQGCYCGSFDNRTTGGSYTEDCISEKFTTLINGAVATITNSRYGWGDLTTTQGSSQYYDKQFFDAVWGEAITNIAETNADSKHDCIPYINYAQNRWCYYEINVLAEPSLDLWTDEPQNLLPNFPAAVMLGSASMEVTVPGLAEARVCLSMNGVIHGVGFTNASGVCTLIFSEPLLTLGAASLVVSAHNYIPYEGQVMVIPPTGAYVIYQQAVVDDQQGNANGQWDYAETIYLDMTVQNVGVNAADNVQVVISSADPLVTILQNTANFGSIAQGGSAALDNAFQVSVSGASADNHIANFTLQASSGASVWDSYFSILVNAPNVEFSDLVIDDASGNGNGNLDPGESAQLQVTLFNDGGCYSTGLQSTLSTTDPYITVTSAAFNYGQILAGGQATGNFNVTVSSLCPQEHTVVFNINYTDALGYAGQDTFSTVVGDITYNPTGPDAYGYRAYDPNDFPEFPLYQWIEISPDSGGAGTLINFTQDDQVLHFALPFTFQYYGFEYDSLTIATNGWLGMGIITSEDYSNSGIPSDDGPAAMIAAYWEDLSPQRTNSGRVWQWIDAANHRYIVEYNHIEQFDPVGSFETFQVILFDPDFYPTSTGDGRILVNYKDMSNVACTAEGTVGIENPAETTGLQYLFDGALDQCAMPLQDGMCVLYTTPVGTSTITVTLTPENPPIVIPASGGSFNFHAEIANTGSTAVSTDIWTMIDLPSGSQYGPVIIRTGVNINAGFVIARNLTQNIPGGAPAGNYAYNLYTGNYASGNILAQDSFDFSKSGVDAPGQIQNWELFGWDGEQAPLSSILPAEYQLCQNCPNPFNPITSIEYALPQAVKVRLAVYNTLGQEVAVLLDGLQPAGFHTVEFNAGTLSSGIYFYRLEAGDFSDMKKMALIK